MADRSGFQPLSEATAFQAVEHSHARQINLIACAHSESAGYHPRQDKH
jgi:hypothetical protein